LITDFIGDVIHLTAEGIERHHGAPLFLRQKEKSIEKGTA